MNTQSENNCCSSLSMRARMAQWWSNLAGRVSRAAEVRSLDPQVAAGISRDLGTGLGELRVMAAKWPDSSAELLGRRLRALDLDPADIARSQPAVARDLAVHCTLCTDKTQCRHDLDRSPGSSEWQDYCVNTATLNALKSERDGGKNGGHS
jgi:hypothetical protein